MADSLLSNGDPKNPFDGHSENPGTASSSLLDSLFPRRIKFEPARKHFNGLCNGGGDFQLETLNPSSSDPYRPGSNMGQLSLKGKKTDRSEFVESGFDPELSFEITFRRIGAGLENLGNTCFLNSVLQCLTYTEPLAAYLQSGKHQNSCHIAGFCALCAIQKHVSRALQSSGRILAPKDLVSNLRCISRNFRNARQEDAHEYMVNLLESMHKCCLPSGVPSESPSAYDKSLVHKIFGGRLRSQVKCMQCSYCSNTFDPFLDLSLDIVKADSLHKALKNFTAAELLDGGEKQYQCQRCNQKVRALKQLTVHKAPYVLTIHLKRFHSHNLEAKIHKKIQFGPTLDLKPFVSGSYDGDLNYTLYGVLVHHGGSTRSGHYYCYVRTASSMWYTLDDNRVFHVGDRIVLEQQAYMLFYVRDKRNVVQKKPNVAIKENMKVYPSGIITSSITDHSLKDTSVCQDNGWTKENSVPKRVSVSVSSPGSSLTEEPLKRPSVRNPNIENGRAKTNGMGINHGNANNGGIGYSSSSVATSPNFSNLKSSCVPAQAKVGDFPSKISVDNSSAENADNKSKMLAFDEVKASSSSFETKGSLIMKDSKSFRKFKRKLLKCRFTSMHFRSNMLFRASLLSLQKKKKYRRGTKSLTKEHLQDCISCDLGPSTSEKTSKAIIVSTHSQRKRTKQRSKGANDIEVHSVTSNGKALMDTTGEEYRKRNDGNSVLETRKKVSVVPSSISIEKKSSKMQDDSISMTTHGMKDSVDAVPRWDGVELPGSQIVEPNGVESTSIGYVADEWDEEYDRGKRKKIRNSEHGFGGPNLFQEIATEKSQWKKAKVEISSSANGPFRI